MSSMKKTLIASALLFATAQADTHLVESNRQASDEIAITLYNNGTALVNESRSVLLKKGINQLLLKDVSAQIRPQTTHLKNRGNSALQLIEQNFDYDLLSPHAMLEKSLGTSIEIRSFDPTGQKVQETATVLSTNGGLVLQYPDRIETGLPKDAQLIFKQIPDGLKASPTLSLLLASEADEAAPLEITYLTGGFDWQADYIATLSKNETEFDLTGWITLKNNSGTTFENSKLQLVAGDVNQTPNYGSPRMMKASMVVMDESAYLPSEESFSDFHLYTLPMKTTLKNNQEKQLSLLSANAIPLTKEYRFTHYVQDHSESKNRKAAIYLLIDNTEASNLGMPLPQGVFRVYQERDNGEALFIGENRIPHVAANETFEVNTGNAFDVSVSESVTQFERITKTRTQSSHQVIFKNAKKVPVVAKYTEQFGMKGWRLLSVSHEPSQKVGTSATWNIEIPAESSVTLTYKVDLETESK
ncbi:MAG: DUF4139 domain-containing protein [Xanthomonadaceae bacterium]|nr:DUF4139 domain-containing protein [Xanthomonadaceae bacterium]